jgi:hypothetical protein
LFHGTKPKFIYDIKNNGLIDKSGVYLKHPISGEDFDTLVIGF